MLPYGMIAGGNFTLESITQPVDIELQAQNPPDYIWMRNRSAWGDAAEGTQAVEYEWHRGMAQGTAQGQSQTTATLALTSVAVSSDGISTYDTFNPPVYAALASTDINLTTFVVAMANTGTIAVGDFVRVTVPVDMYQVSSYVFQVTAVTANVSITLGYMATAVTAGLTAFAANANTANITKIIPNRMYPRWNFPVFITQAAQAKVYFPAKNDFTPGEIVGFRVSSAYGMNEINNKDVRVLSVINSATESSIVIDLDTSGYSAFVFPTSAVALAGVSPAVVVPSASGVVPNNGSATIAQEPPGTNLRDSFDNRNVRLIHLGASLFADSAEGDIWDWYAMKYDQFNQQ